MGLALKSIALVFLGGGIGSVLRLGVLHTSRLLLPSGFPFGTVAVNVIGGLAAGAIAAALLSRSSGEADPLSLFLLTGLLGGFTTFSAFSLDAVQLWQRGEAQVAAIYVAVSVLTSIAGVLIGMWGVLRFG